MSTGQFNLKVVSLAVFLVWSPSILQAQQPKAASNSGTENAVTPEKALALAGQGHCKEAIPALKKVMSSQGSADTRKTAGVAGLRCALGLDNRDAALDFARLLGKQFPTDPDVLFVLVHAYSDLSTRAAQDLGRAAPESMPAHKLNAEALETQGKWDEAAHEYEGIIEKQPNTPGIHYLLGRLLLVRSGADAKSAERAKEEFQKELQIDPSNAGAHYVLGEIAAKNENWDEAIKEFTSATRLDPTFADAYIGLGFSLITVKRYEEAIVPLRAAERLVPQNPAVHYSLATALGRVGKKEEADKELAIHQSLVSSGSDPSANQKPQ
jgi:tetratricopeptide (TPR) repeat protein